jgi:hypothetical protein
MPAIFDLLYREYCCARLVEMRKQLLISPPEMHEARGAPCEAKGDRGASPVGGSETTGPPRAFSQPYHFTRGGHARFSFTPKCAIEPSSNSKPPTISLPMSAYRVDRK